ncbi:uncharacterized protein LOC101234650 [Anopheles sinensis]|uniref:Uncharacterized protein LOC101234650 n=1 Tax=Anopheles sinensis TaxID=74873 RepID=A0A084VJM6_ANOSI|nr:uncharacterized protein LOC101234650 [Anopheles sinensis]
MDAGYSRSGIYKILVLLGNNESIERKPGSGRPTTLSNLELQRKLKRKTEGKVAVSLRALGREAGATGQTVKKYLANMDIQVRKRTSRPMVSEQQAKTQRKRLGVMVRSILPANRDLAVIMDDETYLTLDGNDWQVGWIILACEDHVTHHFGKDDSPLQIWELLRKTYAESSQGLHLQAVMALAHTYRTECDSNDEYIGRMVEAWRRCTEVNIFFEGHVVALFMVGAYKLGTRLRSFSTKHGRKRTKDHRRKSESRTPGADATPAKCNSILQ